MANDLREAGRIYLRERCEEMDGTWDEKCSALKDEVKEKFNIVLTSGEQLRSIIKRMNGLIGKTKKISEALGEERLWEVRDGHYFIEAGEEVFKLSVQEADALFADFSKHGGNLSGQAIRQKYGMSAKAWNHIKSKLELYKDSHVFSPHTAETLDEEELDAKIVEVIGDHFDDRVVKKMVVTGEQKWKSEAEKAMRFMYNVEYRLELVKQAISELGSLDFVPPKVEIQNDDEVTFAFGDIHYGSKNHHEIVKRHEIITQDCITCPERKVNVIIGGDVFEYLGQGEMHPGSRQFDMSAEFQNGFVLLLDVVKLFASSLKRIREAGKEVNFFFVPGNHDRTCPKNEDDKIRMGGLVFGEMLKMALANCEVGVQYATERVSSLDYGSVRFIVAHGDGAFQKRSPDLIVNKWGDRQKYHAILSFDKHNLNVKEGLNYTWVIMPAIKGEGEYDKDLLLYSEPGYAKLKSNQFWTLDVQFKRLPK